MPETNNEFLQQVIAQCQEAERKSLSDQCPPQIGGLTRRYADALEESCCAFHAAMTLTMIATHYWKTVCREVGTQFQSGDDETIEKRVKMILESLEAEKVKSAEAAYYLLVASLTILFNLHQLYPSGCPADGIVER